MLACASTFQLGDRAFQPDPYEFATVGMQFFKAPDGAFPVVAVWTPSPAEAAGVVVGGRIAAVNGRPSVELELEAFANQLHGAPGTPIAIEVPRPAGNLILHMRARQLVCEPSAAN